MDAVPAAFWALDASDLLQRLRTSPRGLTDAEASQRAGRAADHRAPRPKWNAASELLGQFANPINLMLIASAVLSFFVRDVADGIIILTIIVASGLLGFWQEHSASRAVQQLLSMVQTTTRVLRDGVEREIPSTDVVSGDVIVITAGASVPADCRILEAKDLFVNEAALTGETYPVEKSVGQSSAEAPLARRTNALFLGTHVVSGQATAVVVHRGAETEFGGISQRLRLRPPETEFERGVRRFGYFLVELTLLLAIGIFAVNVWQHKPVLDSFLFSLALAVGLTPQLLPAVISVNLSHGARQMAAHKVIVRRLASIENFGSMNVLCSDKTGTLTEGRMQLAAALDVKGEESPRVRRAAALNAAFETGFSNPLDEALRQAVPDAGQGARKLDEVPYDFVRKRLTVLVEDGDRRLILTKGAVPNVLEICTKSETAEGRQSPLDQVLKKIDRQFSALSGQGLRTLAVAYRELEGEPRISRQDEHDMILLGLVAFVDPPKAAIADTIGRLRRLGVELKIITGDNRLVSEHVARQVGWKAPTILTGQELRRLSNEALVNRARCVDVFAEVEPAHKERIVLALKKSGNVVGYLGDGINDASALHAADVGISVDDAVDVAKEAADIVLLEHDLQVLVAGVQAGRTTFANTLKYVFMATSANFGNMFSMAGAALFLPFLPLLPKQVLLTNLLTDLPEMAIASDRVDPETVRRPRRWDLHHIRNFMLTFGTLSSVFDYLTFLVLLVWMGEDRVAFRTGWFLESVVSATLIVLVVRTRRSFFRGRPSRALFLSTLGVVAATLVLPWTPLAGLLGFAPPTIGCLAALAWIIAAYVAATEAAKRRFFRPKPRAGGGRESRPANSR